MEDRRGRSGSGGGGINPLLLGFLIKLLFSKGGLVILGIVILFSVVKGTNPLDFIGGFLGGGGQGVNTESPYQPSSEVDELAEFTSVFLTDTEGGWNQLLEDYREPTLV